MSDQPGTRGPAAGLVDAWQAARAELRALEVAEHPPFADRHGRTWEWKDGDLWTHDGTLAFTRSMIDTAGLPKPGLAGNPNYADLCAICTSGWPVHAVTFDPRPIAGPGSLDGLRRMTLADARSLVEDAAKGRRRRGRIIDTRTLAEVPPYPPEWTLVRESEWDRPAPAHLGAPDGGHDYGLTRFFRRTWPQDGSQFAGITYEQRIAWQGPTPEYRTHVVIGHSDYPAWPQS